MRAPFTGEPGADWQLVADSYRFSGPPDACEGELRFVNLSPRKMRIRRLSTTRPPRARKGFNPLSETELRLSLNLLPESEGQANAYLGLPPDTPPGRYLAWLSSGEHRATLEVEVKPIRSFEPDPDEIALVANAGETVSFTIAVHNSGNLPVTIDHVGLVWLTEENWLENLLVSTLQETGDEEDYETIATHLLHKARQDVPGPGELALEPSLGAQLAPGDTTGFTVTLTLPDNLEKGRGYTGFIRINEERVDLEVYCNGPP